MPRLPVGGLSFTAPTSYWYMRHFDMENLPQYVDWINLMTYDLHGSWDSPEDQIGSFVYALIQISPRYRMLSTCSGESGVPANKVNLGLGFYGRTYRLNNPSCTSPGCSFEEAGRAGPWYGTSPRSLYLPKITSCLSLCLATYTFCVADTKILSFSTGTAGILEYREIMDVMKDNQFTSVLDSKAGVNYFAYDENQWVSFDDVRTLKQKVDFANKNGKG